MNKVEAGDVCLEFGVWHGASINWMAATRPESAFHGFDSFEGLPEDWIKGHPRGHFKVDRSKLKFHPNVTIHEGWFDETLTRFFLNFGSDHVRLIHVDCDLGSSCDTVLSLAEGPILQRKALLLFDEFYNYAGYEDHEFASFLKFIQRTEAEFEVVARNVRHQQVLIQML
jgi:hypothetical protein